MEDSPARAPRRRERPQRRPERQQIMLRRGLALGGGLIVLILIVLGVKGCLDARANRELSDYARNVTQIVEETDQTSKAFFGKLDDPGSLSVTDFIAEVNADRSAMDNYASRVDGLSAPGDMGRAQNALELTYELRSQRDDRNRRQDADRARRRRRRQGDGGDRPADAQAARRRRPLRRRRPARNQRRPRQQRDRRQRRARRASSCRTRPSGWKKARSPKRSARSAAPAAATTSGVHGLGLSGVSINGTELGEEARRRRGRRRGRSRSRRSKTRANRPRTASASRSPSRRHRSAGRHRNASAPAKPAPPRSC